MKKSGRVSGFRAPMLGLGWLVCCAALAGCDGETDHDDDGSGPSSAPVGADDFAARFAARYCGSIGPCCERFGETFDLADCTSLTESYLRSALQTQLDSLKVEFDESLAGHCIDAYGDALEACTDRDDANVMDEACRGLLRGTVPLGGACSEGIECERSAGERVTCSSGVCVLDEEYVSLYETPHAALGEPCAGTCEYEAGEGGSCFSSVDGNADSENACWIGDGLVCEAGLCEAAPALGQACSSYCAGGNHCSVGTCAAPITSGPCPHGNECAATHFCYYADAAAPAECVPRKADGEACDSDDECLGGACEGDHCRKWSVATRQSCAGLFDD